LRLGSQHQLFRLYVALCKKERQEQEIGVIYRKPLYVSADEYCLLQRNLGCETKLNEIWEQVHLDSVVTI